MNGIALSPAVSEKSWSSAANDNHSPNSAMISVNASYFPEYFPRTHYCHLQLCQILWERKADTADLENWHPVCRRCSPKPCRVNGDNTRPFITTKKTTRVSRREENWNRGGLGSEGEDSDDAHKSWCFCGEASYGDMVCCDNEHVSLANPQNNIYLQCTIQWFHYECIGMTATPKGKWYCPRCVETSFTNPSSSIEPTSFWIVSSLKELFLLFIYWGIYIFLYINFPICRWHYIGETTRWW